MNMNIKSFFTKILDLIEGPPKTIYLGQDPVLLVKIKDAVSRYSKLPPEATAWWDGVTPDFHRFQTELWPKEDEDIQLFITVLSRAINDYFWCRNENLAIVIIPDGGSQGQVVIQGYYGHSLRQNQKLARWYMRRTTDERNRALEQFTDLRDKALEKELEEVKNIDQRILAKESEKKKIGTPMKIRAGSWVEEKSGKLLPLYIPLQTHPHLVLSGKSGSGKGTLLLLMIYSALSYRDLTICIGDPKNSGDFEGITPQYATGEKVADLVENVYKKYQEIKQDKTGEKILLVLDEYPSFIMNLENQDKKRAGVIKNMIAELLMQGRALPGGGSVMIWLVAQRADADYFPKGARLNFMTAIGLGRLDVQSKTMLFPGEELPEYEPTRGTGLILMDGKPLKVFRVPTIDVEGLKKLLKEKARRRSGGHADSEPGGAST